MKIFKFLLIGIVIVAISCSQTPETADASFVVTQKDVKVDTVNVFEFATFVSEGSGDLLVVYPGDNKADYMKRSEGNVGKPFVGGSVDYMYIVPGEYTAYTVATSYADYAEKSITDVKSKKIVVVDKRNEIKSLSIPQINGKSIIDGSTIKIPIPASVFNTARIYTTFTLNSDSSKLVFNGIVVKSGDSLNFSTLPTIAVRPYNGPDKVYTVTLVSTPVSSAKEFLTYNIKETAGILKSIGIIDTVNKTISVPIAFGTKVSALTHEFKASTDAKVFIGSVQQKSGVIPKINLTNPITYSVQALDLSKQNYVVTATIEQALKTFKIKGLENPIVIDYGAGTVTIKVFTGTKVNALVAEMTGIENSNVTFGASNTAFVNGVTAIDFTSPVVFTIKGKGDNTQIKTITVSVVEV